MGAHGIYHERQIRELCALHALNNLFQGKCRQSKTSELLAKHCVNRCLFLEFYLTVKGTFTKSELDSICVQLSPDDWINPHKSLVCKYRVTNFQTIQSFKCDCFSVLNVR